MTSHITMNNTTIRQVLVFISILGVIFTFAQPVVAQTAAQLPSNYTLLEPLPCIPSPASTDAQGNVSPAITCAAGEMKTTVNFKEYVQYMFNLLIAMAAVSAVFVIVWGGFQYMTSDAYNEKSEGLAKAKNAILGLLLVLCSFLILQTIDPRLVRISDTFVPALQIPYNKNIYNTLFDRLRSSADQLNEQSARARTEIAAAEARAAQFQQEKLALQEQLAQAQQRGDGEEVARIETQISDVTDRINGQKILAVSTLGVSLLNNIALRQVNKDSLEAVDQDRIAMDRVYLKGVAELKAITNPPNELAMKALLDAKGKTLRTLLDRQSVIINKK